MACHGCRYTIVECGAADGNPVVSAPAAPVAIGKVASYDDDVTAKLANMFDQLGGIETLVKNKTVTIKLNLTGAPTNRMAGRPPGFTHWANPAVAGAAASSVRTRGSQADPLRREFGQHHQTA